MTQDELNKKFLRAVWREDINKIEECLNDGADINANNHKNALSNLLEYIGYGDKERLDKVNFLIDKGIDINLTDFCGRTALYFSINIYTMELATRLLKKGCDINIRTNKGETPLHKAVRVNNSFVRLLLKFGARTDIKNNKGQTPLDLAISKNKRSTILILEDYNDKKEKLKTTKQKTTSNNQEGVDVSEVVENFQKVLLTMEDNLNHLKRIIQLLEKWGVR